MKKVMKKHKKCNWCGVQKLMENKKLFCQICSEHCLKECAHCHKPYPSLKYFILSDKRCNSCERKYVKQKENRKKKIKSCC